MTPVDTREVPCDLPAEQSLLGAALIRPSLMIDLINTVDAGDFMKAVHGNIYASMCDMHQAGQPIDAITVKGHMGPGVDMETLAELTAVTPSVSAWKGYADRIIETSRRRYMIQHYAELINRTYQHGSNIEDIIGESDPAAVNRLVAPRNIEVEGLFTLADFMDAAIREVDHKPFLVPHMIKAMWRVVIVAGEGVGKATLMRYIAVHAAAGRDLWQPDEFVDPVRCLYVDVENSASSILHQIRIANRTPGTDVPREVGDRFHIWHREGGMNLRDRRTRAEFESVLQRTRPQIVFAGPLYKLFRRKPREDHEEAALEFTEIIDDLRVRYGFAIVLEAHAPKASGGGYREMSPTGSSLFLRWPEFGISLDVVGGATMDAQEYEIEVSRFRRDREVADWPQKLYRGRSLKYAWTPYFERGRCTALGDL